MAELLFTNNASSTLASALSNSATSLTLVSGGGSAFPSPTSGQYFIATISSASNPTLFEIIHCTARSTDTLTILRGQEGTGAMSWNAGDYVEVRPTAGGMGAFIQEDQLQQQAGNYAVDTGSADAYAVTLSPAPAAMSDLVGVPVRVKVAHDNTGTVTPTLNVNGLGANPVAYVLGSDTVPIYAGLIKTGAIVTFVWDGAQFQFFGGYPQVIERKIGGANLIAGLYSAHWSAFSFSTTYDSGSGTSDLVFPGATLNYQGETAIFPTYTLSGLTPFTNYLAYIDSLYIDGTGTFNATTTPTVLGDSRGRIFLPGPNQDQSVTTAPPSGYSASVSPTSLSGSAASSTVQSSQQASVSTANSTGGDTYSWVRVSGSSAITANSPTAESTYFTGTGIASGTSVNAVFKCVATDSASSTADSNQITVSLQNTTGGGGGSGGGCVSIHCEVLMADGSAKRARDVRAGDVLMAWDKGLPIGGKEVIGDPRHSEQPAIVVATENSRGWKRCRVTPVEPHQVAFINLGGFSFAARNFEDAYSLTCSDTTPFDLRHGREVKGAQIDGEEVLALPGGWIVSHNATIKN